MISLCVRPKFCHHFSSLSPAAGGCTTGSKWRPTGRISWWKKMTIWWMRVKAKASGCWAWPLPRAGLWPTSWCYKSKSLCSNPDLSICLNMAVVYSLSTLLPQRYTRLLCAHQWRGRSGGLLAAALLHQEEERLPRGREREEGTNPK